MIATTSTVITYTPNGTTTTFSFPYHFLANSDLVVYVDTTLKVLTTDYTVTGAGVEAGGSVVFNTAPTGTTLSITRIMPITQVVDYVTKQNFPATDHEKALDKITMILQQLAARGAIYTGTGSPNGVVVATAPALYYDEVGNLYVKITAGTNTTWP